MAAIESVLPAEHAKGVLSLSAMARDVPSDDARGSRPSSSGVAPKKDLIGEQGECVPGWRSLRTEPTHFSAGSGMSASARGGRVTVHRLGDRSVLFSCGVAQRAEGDERRAVEMRAMRDSYASSRIQPGRWAVAMKWRYVFPYALFIADVHGGHVRVSSEVEHAASASGVADAISCSE